MRIEKVKSLVLLLIYVLVKFGMDSYWRRVSVYYSYLFEVLFVSATWFVFSSSIRFKFILNKKLVLYFLGFFLAGAAAYEATWHLAILVPFDFQSYEGLFLLLILAPILEEFVFRYAIWNCFLKLKASLPGVVFISAILFSIGHLLAYPVVPQEYKTFVLYQSVYVLILGVGAGWVKIKTETISAPIAIHFLFNLGFLLAAKCA